MGLLTRTRTIDEIEAEHTRRTQQLHAELRRLRQTTTDLTDARRDERARAVHELVELARQARSRHLHGPLERGWQELELHQAVAAITRIDPATVGFQLDRLLPDREACANCSRPLRHDTGRWRHTSELDRDDGLRLRCSRDGYDVATPHGIDLDGLLRLAPRP